jgi:hypothetical protein
MGRPRAETQEMAFPTVRKSPQETAKLRVHQAHRLVWRNLLGTMTGHSTEGVGGEREKVVAHKGRP